MLPSKTFKDFPRRMLLQSPFVHPQPAPLPSPNNYQYSTSKHGIGFHIDIVIMIFSVLLCLLVFSIFFSCLMRYLLKCLIWFNTQQGGNKLVANRGIDKGALRTFHVVKYSKEVKLQGLSILECVICLSEFKEGDKLRILPKCKHGFHVKCIDKWLHCHSSCPTCRQSLVNTCQKIIGCDDDHQARSSFSRGMIADGVSIDPLEREDLVRN